MSQNMVTETASNRPFNRSELPIQNRFPELFLYIVPINPDTAVQINLVCDGDADVL